jgi:hypothetical protein
MRHMKNAAIHADAAAATHPPPWAKAEYVHIAALMQLSANETLFLFIGVERLIEPNQAVLRTRITVTGHAWLARPRRRPFR